jgi:glutathione synthase/RimK-type ligase-like ATP-grasp enzyme
LAVRAGSVATSPDPYAAAMLDPRPDAPVALLTTSAAAHLDVDLPLLVDALAALELTPAVVDWHDAEHDWAGHELVVVRSTWDYTDHLDEFLAVLSTIAGATVLANPLAAVTANVDKRYLTRLAARGVPVVPTAVVEPGEGFEVPAGAFVVKPVVSAGARDTERYDPEELGAARGHVDALHAAGRAALVQPYVPGVDEHGETGLVYLADELSHGFRKGPLLRPGVSVVEGLYREEQITPRRPTDAEREVAEAALDAVDAVDPTTRRSDLLYARVDLVPGPDGPILMELELVEPALFLDMGDGAPARAAAAIDRHLAGIRGSGRRRHG